MPLPPPAPLDEGWQVVSPEWWRIPFGAVSWAYTPTDPPQDVAATKVTQSPRVAKPPHYHAALFRIRAASADDQQHDDDLVDGDDGQLNPDLVGFKGAVAAIESYEIDVGFHWPSLEIEEKRRPDLALAVNEDHVALAKERWDELVQDLTGGLLIGSPDRYHESDDELRGLHRSTSTHSSIDLTDSERSVLSVSMPATPRSYANIVVKTTSPSRSASSRDSNRSPRRLNAAASTFVPGPSKAKAVSDPAPFLVAPEFPSLNVARPHSPSFNTNFVFPSLDVPPLPAVKIAKDAQGFYSEVESTAPAPASGHARTSSTLLPAFLHDAFTRRRPPASKTRAIVDRLKSSGSVTSEEPTKTQPARPQLELSTLAKPRLSVSEYGGDGESPAIDDDSEGWIGGDDLTKAVAVNSKTRRTRDLFLALTRRRSNSSPPKPTLIVEAPAEDAIGITVELPSPTSSSSNDGWIEGPSLLLPVTSKAKPAAVHLPERKATPAAEAKHTPQRQPSPRAPKKAKRTGPVPMQPPPPAHVLYARPPPPYYYPHAHPHAHPPVPVPYAAAYMHQMQVLQMQQQHQMHMRRVSAPAVSVPVPVRTPRGSFSSTGSGEWFPYPMPVAAYPMPVLHPQPVFVPHGV
ncbi:hypothetical protein B0H19DRAFT_15514 [Mycena capillaripes]|nr:hypothetical protein B0H19DRAFT_15514 [Mycena capillaripes]